MDEQLGVGLALVLIEEPENLLLDFVLFRVRAANAVAEHFQAVVVVRIVRCGNHDSRDNGPVRVRYAIPAF